IRAIQGAARSGAATRGTGSAASRPWPMIILRTPKGWTGPKEVDGKPTEGSFRSHQVPLPNVRRNPAHLRQLEAWLRSYRPEELCEGWLEGYLLTGRHGLFTSYEAFIHIVDSMFNQHAKWLKSIREIEWRRPIASLNYLLSSHVWRQDHNGFSHQDPGFIDHVVNKKAEIIRVYLPPDANTLLSVTDHCLRSRNYVNVIVAGKQRAPQWLDMDAAIKHCTAGIGIWPPTWLRACRNSGRKPRTSGKRFATSSSSTNNTSPSTARICRRFEIGNGAGRSDCRTQRARGNAERSVRCDANGDL